MFYSTYCAYYIVHNPTPAGNYMSKVNNRNTIARCEICSKLTIKILWTFNCRLGQDRSETLVRLSGEIGETTKSW